MLLSKSILCIFNAVLFSFSQLASGQTCNLDTVLSGAVLAPTLWRRQRGTKGLQGSHQKNFVDHMVNYAIF